MESTQSQNPIENKQTAAIPESTEKALEELLKSSAERADTIIVSATPEGKPIIHHTRNLYPVVRHTILIVLILLFSALIIFLMIQNGKSIYENGI
jgi:hypothetical protein